jgi:aryl-alcohol dehydrogenase-like predicted oxidoreductase
MEEGWASSPVEAAIRFALSYPLISTALIGLSSLKQLSQAIKAAEKGPLSTQALERLPAVWQALGSA